MAFAGARLKKQRSLNEVPFYRGGVHESCVPESSDRRSLLGKRVGAGTRNRTELHSLEGWCITTMLYPLRVAASYSMLCVSGGGDWIRTSVRKAGRFTVCWI